MNVATPTTPLGRGVLVGEDGRRLVARAREMQYNAGVLKTFDEVREIRGGGREIRVGEREMQYNASVLQQYLKQCAASGLQQSARCIDSCAQSVLASYSSTLQTLRDV